MEERYSKLKAEFDAEPGSRIGSGATSGEIADVESSLGVALPASYRWFLSEIGAAAWPDYIYGAGAGVRESFTVISLTRSERTEMRPPMPAYLIPFAPDGRGNHYCLDTSQMADDECPIAFWDHELGPDQDVEIVNTNFLDWLEEMVADAKT